SIGEAVVSTDAWAAFEGRSHRPACRRVPDLETVGCERNDPLALGEEIQETNGRFVGRDRELCFPTRGPELDRSILSARGDKSAVGAESDAAREALVPAEVGKRPAGGDLPQLDVMVIAHGDEKLTVGTERQG